MKISKREKATVKNTPFEWVEYQDGVAFELYGMSHPLYTQAQIKLARREMHEDLCNLSNEEGLEDFFKITGSYLVKDWRGIYDADGNELPCNYDNFVDVAMQVDGLLGWIHTQAVAIDARHAEQVENTKKKPSKGGNTKG